MVASVSAVCNAGPREIVWQMPLAFAGHLVAQSAARNGAKLERPLDDESVINALDALYHGNR